MRKVYEEYKVINVNEIEGVKFKAKSIPYIDKIARTKRRIRMVGIKEPFEVEKTIYGYKLMSHPITFIAAKELNYDAVPCLIRNPMHELILNKTLRKLNMD